MDVKGDVPDARRPAPSSTRLEPDLIRLEATRVASGLFRHRATTYVFRVRKQAAPPRR